MQMTQTATVPHIDNWNQNDEWFTPDSIIDKVWELYAEYGLNLDPASNDIANDFINAHCYYNKRTDGLTKSWSGNVFLNPPYSTKLIRDFSQKVIEERGNYDQCVVLVPSKTETQYFQRLIQKADAVCFPSSRIKFWHPTVAEKDSKPKAGNALFYYGDDLEQFKYIFEGLGHTIILD